METDTRMGSSVLRVAAAVAAVLALIVLLTSSTTYVNPADDPRNAQHATN